MKAFLKYVKNIYIIVSFLFLVWMAFFDANSWFFTQRELNKELKRLHKQREFLINQIQEGQKILKDLQSEEELERFAREAYFLNKNDEETYIIDIDTLND